MLFRSFSANDGIHGQELWKSDGTSDGTVLVGDFWDGGRGSYPNQLTNVDGTLFFWMDGESGWELWKSDGTSNGTILVQDASAAVFAGNPTNVNGTLFFSAWDDLHGHELWKSDGTSNGTMLVLDIADGSRGGSPSSLTNVNGTQIGRAHV